MSHVDFTQIHTKRKILLIIIIQTYNRSLLCNSMSNAVNVIHSCFVVHIILIDFCSRCEATQPTGVHIGDVGLELVCDLIHGKTWGGD